MSKRVAESGGQVAYEKYDNIIIKNYIVTSDHESVKNLEVRSQNKETSNG